MNYLVQQVSTL